MGALPLKVTIDVTAALGDRTGVGTYVRGIVRGLLLTGEPRALTLGAHVFRHAGWRRKLEAILGGSPGGFRVRASRLIPHGALLELDRLVPLPYGELLFGDADVYHGTNFLAPPFRRARTVVTIHDLAFLRHEREVPVAHHYRRYLSRALARADRAIAVSRATADDLVAQLGFPADRIAVVPEGAPTHLPTMEAASFEEERLRLGIPDRYFLFVGTLEPRKNLVRLLAAYRRAAARLGEPIGLVFAGRPGWYDQAIRAAVREIARRLPVVRTGFVSEPLRNSLYAHATALAFPSLYEGFGLPVLEAFALGCPVLSSRVSALPEVAGDAALLVDPRNEDEIADGLERLATEAGLREELAGRGCARVREFTWERAARATWEVYRDAL